MNPSQGFLVSLHNSFSEIKMLSLKQILPSAFSSWHQQLLASRHHNLNCLYLSYQLPASLIIQPFLHIFNLSCYCFNSTLDITVPSIYILLFIWHDEDLSISCEDWIWRDQNGSNCIMKRRREFTILGLGCGIPNGKLAQHFWPNFI